MAHGSGGRASRRLLEGLILKYLGNSFLNQLEDQASLPLPAGGRLAFTTDSYVVNPIFFAGGDIGRLAVCGTVNDLAVGGATPLYLSLGLIIEEGLDFMALEKILASIHATCREAAVQVVTGDTKVVNRGAADKIFINTSGVGIVPEGVELGAARIRAGDKIILSGGIGEHALTIMLQREGLGIKAALESDVAPLNELAAVMLGGKARINAMRDPTRGGLASLLNEWANRRKLTITIEEEAIPVCEAVRGGCEILGLDPLYLANEGKLVAAVAAADAETLLTAMKQHPLGRDAAIIGEVSGEETPQVVLRTRIGGKRLLSLPEGELLPRIC